LRPFGDVYRYSSIRIDLPPEIAIFSKFDFEKSCGSRLKGFTNDLITCKTWDNKIYVNQGFDAGPTTNSTTTVSTDVGLQTPYLEFDLTGFVNPRSLQTSGQWNITILNEYDKPYYFWQ